MYYFLGFVAADGYLTDNELEIGINEKDKYLLEHFVELIVPQKPLYYRPKTNSYTLKLNMKKLMPKLKSFYGMSSNNKHDELIFPSVPGEYVKDFIRGYVDGDGCIDTCKGYQKNTIYIGPRLRILGNAIFLKGLNERIKDFIAHKTNRISPKGKENVFYLTYNFSTAAAILSWLYDDCSVCLTRKNQKYKEAVKKHKMKI